MAFTAIPEVGTPLAHLLNLLDGLWSAGKLADGEDKLGPGSFCHLLYDKGGKKDMQITLRADRTARPEPMMLTPWTMPHNPDNPAPT